MLTNRSLLKLYDLSDSYLWKNRAQIQEAVKVLLKKDLHAESRLLNNFTEWKASNEDSEAVHKDDIGRVLQTTSEATDG